MADLKIYQEYGEELERRLRLKTFPLALKLLEKETDIPAGAKRPLKDFGHHLSLCQVFQMSRRDGRVMAMLKEDHWCFEPVVGYGLGEPPDFFMEGHNRYPRDVATLEAGRHYADEFPRLKVGQYVGIASGPLRATNFEPDLVMIYCDSSQLCLLLLGREYREGYNLKCQISGHAACVYGVIPALETGECQVAVPCRGDHYRAMAGDEEMIFTVPRRRLDDLMVGLRSIEKTGSKLPNGYSFLPEYPLPESYKKIGQMMGYMKR
ncbi:MAG TPA: DUF169 domain-containing protein [Candidatus Methylomirabilis sp.]|nr:DUF169 domain-containing protein [Candidatus Methylomirabilis sp.]